MFLCILSSPMSLTFDFVVTQLVLFVWVVTIFSCDFLWPKQIWKSQCNFWWKDLFDFIVVHLSNFSLYCVSFRGIFEKSLPVPGLQRYLPLFSSKSFIVFWQFNEIWILLESWGEIYQLEGWILCVPLRVEPSPYIYVFFFCFHWVWEKEQIVMLLFCSFESQLLLLLNIFRL